eukprot:10109367-Alexandrium_andersonii.AAC.1
MSSGATSQQAPTLWGARRAKPSPHAQLLQGRSPSFCGREGLACRALRGGGARREATPDKSGSVG